MDNLIQNLIEVLNMIDEATSDSNRVIEFEIKINDEEAEEEE